MNRVKARKTQRRPLMTAILVITALVILLPFLILTVCSFTARWPWPNLLPEAWTGRTIQELLFGSNNLLGILGSSVLLASIVAVLGTTIGLMTARATEIYKIQGGKAISYIALLPLLLPSTAFAMGFQITLIRMGLNDTIMGVVIVHLVAALPYCVTIMMDITAALGDRFEEQAQVLGATPAKSFFDVSLPMMLPGVLSSASMAFIISYGQYFTTLLAGGGKVKTLALVLVPYIQSGDRAISSIYAVVFVGSALTVFFIFEALIHRLINNDARNNK